jgi:hypothetical protein
MPGNGGLGGGGGCWINNLAGYARGGGGGGYSGGQGGTFQPTQTTTPGGGGGGSYFTGDGGLAIAGNAAMPDPLSSAVSANTGTVSGPTIQGKSGGGFIRITFLGP